LGWAPVPPRRGLGMEWRGRWLPTWRPYGPSSLVIPAGVGERPPRAAGRFNALPHSSPTGNAVPLQVAARPFEGCRAFQRPVPGSPLLSRRGATVEVGVCHPTKEGSPVLPVRHGNDGFQGRGSSVARALRMLRGCASGHREGGTVECGWTGGGASLRDADRKTCANRGLKRHGYPRWVAPRRPEMAKLQGYLAGSVGARVPIGEPVGAATRRGFREAGCKVAVKRRERRGPGSAAAVTTLHGGAGWGDVSCRERAVASLCQRRAALNTKRNRAAHRIQGRRPATGAGTGATVGGVRAGSTARRAASRSCWARTPGRAWAGLHVEVEGRTGGKGADRVPAGMLGPERGPALGGLQR
jgi:hypothetical protein